MATFPTSVNGNPVIATGTRRDGNRLVMCDLSNARGPHWVCWYLDSEDNAYWGVYSEHEDVVRRAFDERIAGTYNPSADWKALTMYGDVTVDKHDKN